MNIILIRIASDHSYGEFNAPIDLKTKEFIYFPIPEEGEGNLISSSNSFISNLKDFYKKNNILEKMKKLDLPKKVHLDPDFSTLTYGDHGNKRGHKLKNFQKGDWIIFYAALEPLIKNKNKSPLSYCIIGKYEIEKIMSIHEIQKENYNLNAHTRRNFKDSSNEIIVFANQNNSGRLEKAIEIGSFYEGAYRVEKELLSEWGGLSVKNGFIQRSVEPPLFSDPEKFKKWFDKQNIKLIKENNPEIILEQKLNNNHNIEINF